VRREGVLGHQLPGHSTGQLRVKPERIDIPMLMRGMTDLIRRTLGPSMLIETHFPLSLSAVTADANQVEMALLNLVVNARDAMPNGGVITITTRGVYRTPSGDPVPNANVDTATPWAVLEVRDTGVGFDAATKAGLFQRFRPPAI